jgi:short-subunit dehydrogenase
MGKTIVLTGASDGIGEKLVTEHWERSMEMLKIK